MKDQLMQAFIETGAESFASWRLWCIDHGERHGSYPEFVGRLKRCVAASKRYEARSDPIAAGKAPEQRQ